MLVWLLAQLVAAPPELFVQQVPPAPDVITFDTSGRYAAVVDSAIQVWDVEREIQLFTMPRIKGISTPWARYFPGSRRLGIGSALSAQYEAVLIDTVSGGTVFSGKGWLLGEASANEIVLMQKNAIQLLDAKSGRVKKRVAMPPANFGALCASKRWVATAFDYSDDAKAMDILRIVALDTGKVLSSLTVEKHSFGRVAFSPDCSRLVSTNHYGSEVRLVLVRLDGGKASLERTIAGPYGDSSLEASFSPDGRRLFVHKIREGLAAIDVESGAELSVEAGLRTAARGATRMAAVGQKGFVVFDAATPSALRTFDGTKLGVYQAYFLPQGDALVTVSAGGKVHRIDTSRERRPQPLGDLTTGWPRQLFVSADGRRLYKNGGHVAVYSLPELQVVPGTEHSPKGASWDVALGRDWAIAVFAAFDKVVAIRTDTGAVVWEVPETSMYDVAGSPDGSLVVYTHGKPQPGLHVRDVATGALKYTTPLHSYPSFGKANELYAWSFKKVGAELIRMPAGTSTPDKRLFVPLPGTAEPVVVDPSGRYGVSSGFAFDLTEMRLLEQKPITCRRPTFHPTAALVVCGDEMFTIRALPSLAIVARVLVDGTDDLVVLGPDGRFDATERMRSLIHYVEGGEHNPIDAYFERLYTPGLFAELVGRALGKVDAPQDPIAAPLPTLLPPIVRMRALPESTAEVATIEVEAEDRGGGVDDIVLYLNDKMIEESTRGLQKKARAGATVKKTFKLALLSGDNRVRAVAFDAQRTESAPAELLLLGAGPQATAKLHVLTVGLNAYQNPKYALNYGRPDAEAFVEALRRVSARIFSGVEVVTLFDAQATRPALLAAFERVAKAAAPGDAFVFYYAGHGVMSEREAGNDFFLALHEVTQLYGAPEQLSARGVSATELKAAAASIRAQKQVWLLDACQAGGAVEAFAHRGAADEKAIAQLARSAGLTLIAASGTEQFANEFSALGHGAFTFALLDALSGKADTGGDGKITVRELEAYLDDVVPALTKKHRGTPQYPNSFSRGQDFPLGVRPNN